MSHSDSQSEEEPLLAGTNERLRRVSSRPSPYWLVPVVIVASMARGVSMAPRFQVYNDIACRGLGIALNECKTSSDVQGRAARIQASITTVMSVLSALATGPWSRWGDFHGRKPLLFFTLSGALSMELIYLLVTRKDTPFYNYAEQFVMVGPVLDGLVGGLSAFNGVVHAYTSDCTAPGSRAKIFSTLQGMVFIGLAVGPWFGGLITSIIGSDSPNPYTLFFVSSVMNALLLCFIALVLPESIERKYESSESNLDQRKKPLKAAIKSGLAEVLAGFLSPISIFIPPFITNSEGGRKRDWNLTFAGGALFLYLISIVSRCRLYSIYPSYMRFYTQGVFSIKYLYAKHIYSWSSNELGQYMSLLWITRAINLLVVLPLIVNYLKPKHQPTDPLSIWSELRFDKLLAQASLFVDASADALVAIVPSSSQSAFVAFSCLSSFTSGGNPTLHSLGAVCLHASGRSSEVGSLFGAMAVLSAVAHVISPTLYAVTYGTTVATFPKAIFVLATSLLGTAVLLLAFVRTSNRVTLAARL
ncbi:major facilitator superfamily domain-containing protein [Lentinula aciculospora]|uniref:Major facilitator superfamily domain-containing protein n=1 Tax=Lentinula aciculospora TaxID=153920 RepID=A0A9W9A8S0_9AGAR|nr:major facilitator superfamily domain-containing protein [Lentinula aciculospora]